MTHFLEKYNTVKYKASVQLDKNLSLLFFFSSWSFTLFSSLFCLVLFFSSPLQVILALSTTSVLSCCILIFCFALACRYVLRNRFCSLFLPAFIVCISPLHQSWEPLRVTLGLCQCCVSTQKILALGYLANKHKELENEKSNFKVCFHFNKTSYK